MLLHREVSSFIETHIMAGGYGSVDLDTFDSQVLFNWEWDFTRISLVHTLKINWTKFYVYINPDFYAPKAGFPF